MKEGSFWWIWVLLSERRRAKAAQGKQMPFMRGAGACPSALSRAPEFGVHRSAAKTLDRRSGRIRRRVRAGRALRAIHGKRTLCGEHDLVPESRPTAGKLLAVMEMISIAHAFVSAVSICETACRTWPRLPARSWACTASGFANEIGRAHV